MILRVEDLITRELERRIVEALPETSPGESGEPETFTTTFESRRFTPCVREQENLVFFGEVEAELSVIIYSRRARYDYSPLYASLARDPYIKLDEGLSAAVAMLRCEAVEGPYLTSDAWLFKVTYPIFGVEAAHVWQPPRLANAQTSAQDVYPRSEPDTRNEPGARA